MWLIETGVHICKIQCDTFLSEILMRLKQCAKSLFWAESCFLLWAGNLHFLLRILIWHIFLSNIKLSDKKLPLGDKIEFILKITTVHCVTRVVAQKTHWVENFNKLFTVIVGNMLFMLFWFLPIQIADRLRWHSRSFKPAYWAAINVGPRPSQITWHDYGRKIQIFLSRIKLLDKKLPLGDKIEFILKITTVHCVTRVVAQKTRFNNICKFPRNNPIQNPPFSFSNAQTSMNLDADFRLIYWIEDGLWTEHTKLSITSVFGAHCYTATDYGHMKAKSLILWGPNLNPNPEEIFEMWI